MATELTVRIRYEGTPYDALDHGPLEADMEDMFVELFDIEATVTVLDSEEV